MCRFVAGFFSRQTLKRQRALNCPACWLSVVEAASGVYRIMLRVVAPFGFAQGAYGFAAAVPICVRAIVYRH